MFRFQLFKKGYKLRKASAGASRVSGRGGTVIQGRSTRFSWSGRTEAIAFVKRHVIANEGSYSETALLQVFQKGIQFGFWLSKDKHSVARKFQKLCLAYKKEH